MSYPQKFILRSQKQHIRYSPTSLTVKCTYILSEITCCSFQNKYPTLKKKLLWKWCTSWSDALFDSIWSGSTLFAKVTFMRIWWADETWNEHDKTNTRGPWVTMLTWVNSYKSLIQHFRLSVAMATNQNGEFVQLLYAWCRTPQQTFIKKNLSKYLQWGSNKDLPSLFPLQVNGNFKLP